MKKLTNKQKKVRMLRKRKMEIFTYHLNHWYVDPKFLDDKHMSFLRLFVER